MEAREYSRSEAIEEYKWEAREESISKAREEFKSEARYKFISDSDERDLKILEKENVGGKGEGRESEHGYSSISCNQSMFKPEETPNISLFLRNCRKKLICKLSTVWKVCK